MSTSVVVPLPLSHPDTTPTLPLPTQTRTKHYPTHTQNPTPTPTPILPEHKPKLLMRRMSTITPEKVRWLWPSRLALGKLSVLAGDPGLGKSIITLDIASRVSTGSGWPDCPSHRSPPGSVILMSAEDDPADTIRPRLDAAGANSDNIYALEGCSRYNAQTDNREEPPLTLHDLDTISVALETATLDHPDAPPKLVVVDPVAAYTGKTDSHVNSDVRALLKPLAELASRYQVCVLLITHLNKCSEASAIYRMMGSIGFIAACRSGFGVIKDKMDPTRRLVLPIKNNIGTDQTGLAYKLVTSPSDPDSPIAAWEASPVAITADDAIASSSTCSPNRGPKPVALDEARDFIRSALSDGPVASADLYEQAKELAISIGTLKSARETLPQVRVHRTPGPDSRWVWSWRSLSTPPSEESA